MSKTYRTNYKSQIFHAQGTKKLSLLKHALLPHNTPYPTDAKIEVCGDCNYHCGMCIRRTMNNRKNTFMSMGQFKHIINQLPHISGWMGHGCNEPTLNLNLFKMIEYANARNIRFQLVTNGSRMNEEYTNKLLTLNPSVVRFSVDATGKKYEELRGGSWERFYRHVKYFSERYHAGNYKTRVFLAMAVFDQTFPYVFEILELAMELGFWVSFTDLVIYDTEISKVSNTLAANYSQEKINATFNAIKESYDKVVLNIGYPEVRTCTLPFNSIFIRVDGDVFPCGCVAHLDKYILGNVFYESVKDIYNNENYQKFRVDSCSGNIPECNECKAFSLRMK